MKKKLNTKKLNIDLETVRALSERELVNVAGGLMNNTFGVNCISTQCTKDCNPY